MRGTLVKTEARISSPKDVWPLAKPYANKRVEHFLVFTLNGNHAPIKRYVVTMGLVNRTIVHPREVFYFAIKDMATAIVICHNHPSGSLAPSPEDLEITSRLQEAGTILGINVLDHLIVSRNGYVSLVEMGQMSPFKE